MSKPTKLELKLADAFNEWMARFIANPELCAREFQIVNDYLEDVIVQKKPRYGVQCARYIMSLMK